ncbi:Mu transposase C-terminal domain-containing protein [Mycobacterium avium subsp. hominissuis]|uniref:Mu transposase C-terminal domain-containing protein n=1 Tax=Mycobacterium avium TaxID=1764 RepID=UPI00293B826A|nr:Mu transposase C-terminal domain-containing protein [Mycobacterium avium]MDV3245715.1 Mu transposase C-terminal domain-containing protein [Mycobacterium avium subsp. hominissuis]MDV3276695.1 Mu transposase C-terminal domain-containing protein [Mycobacterium avium subsp. hominissuis]MDV3324233.1 Mu transposase C-terminal domain-containing protein [Mycobacterium avium subsp. hominissuis]
MRSVRLFDCLQYDGDSWQVVAQDGPTLALKNLTTGRIRKVAVADMLGDDSYLPDSPDRLPNLDAAAVLETLDPETRRRAEFLHHHVVEVLTGVPPVRDGGEVEPRPEYHPRNLLGDRIEAKLAELRATGTPMSARTLQRHLAAYRRDGVAGLVDGRRIRESSPTGRIDPRLVSLLEAAIDGQTNLSTGTKSRVIAQVKREAQQLGVPIPGRSTLYEALGSLHRSKHPFGNATTRRSQANRPDRSWGGQSPSRPGELVEIDSTPLDLMVVFPDGSAGRVELTAALDIATRTPCAAILRPVATKAVDAAVLLARALTPLPMQPGWDASVAFSRSILPAGMIPGDDELHAGVAAKPVIVPESITVDRGKVYVGSTFMNACERLQISVTKAAPRTPTDKPHIERVFAAINSGFTQYLAGYAGPNVVRRGKSPEQEAFWTLAEVQNLLDLWIVAVWQNKPHPGLRHPAMPKKDLTPNEAYAALAGVAPTTHVVLGRDDYIGLLPVAWRSIQPYGINFEGLHYDSPELHPLRGVSSGLPGPARGRWEIRYDPYRLQSVFVRDHRQGRWIEAEWTLARRALAPFSLDVLRAARKAVDRRDETAPAVDVLAEINRIQTSGANTTRERKAAQRDSVNTPVVPGKVVADTAEDLDAVDTDPSSTPGRPRQRRAARRIDIDEEH